jgi:hypothetical protein
MTIELEKSRFASLSPGPGPDPGHDPGPATAADFAVYTRDMLESLRKIARQQELCILAHLLELTQAEATLIIRHYQCQHPDKGKGPPVQAQQTRFPG